MGASQRLKVFIGFDPNEMAATVVADHSLKRHCPGVDSHHLSLLNLQYRGWYRRPMVALSNGTYWDTISDAPMTTGHAIGRFFVPMLCGYEGWALFTDGDVLFLDDVRNLMDYADPAAAVLCVQHPPLPAGGTKKDGMVQTTYPRKNWSSVMLWNCAHPANKRLTLDVLNGWPGRDLHAFNWLVGDELGRLPDGWNHLVNVSAEPDHVHLAHFTLGTPNLPGHGSDPYADEWFAVAKTAGYSFERERVSA